MTREKIKSGLSALATQFNPSSEESKIILGAVEALEQEPCEDWYDVPSDEMTLGQARQAVKDLRKKLAEYLWQEPCDCISREDAIRISSGECHFSNILKELKNLPSVNPQPKTGRWINNSCSECGIYNASAYKSYCPNCGCCMVEMKESEG